MNLIVGENTYVSLADALEYFSDRFGDDSFTSLTQPEQESILAMSTVMLDSLGPWVGSKLNPNQLLDFPRLDGIIPENIIAAQCEISNNIASAGGSTNEGDAALKKMQVDVITFEWNAPTQKDDPYTNPYIFQLIKQYRLSSAIGGGNRVIRT